MNLLIFACTPNFEVLRGGSGPGAGASSESGFDAGGSDSCVSSACAGTAGSGHSEAGRDDVAGGAPSLGGAGSSAHAGAGAGAAAGTDVSAGIGAGGSADEAGEAAGGAMGLGGSGGANEVELFGTASADSEELGVGRDHFARLANDGDLSTRWTAADGAVGHYWTLALTGAHLLSRIQIMWEYPPQAAGGSYRYTVGVSNDNVGYVVAIDQSASTLTDQTQNAPFPAGSSGSYVRITVVGLPPPAGLESWAGIYEVRLFGQ